ncbi:MAG: GGDEF domain-containing protein [Lachnospiraceae bacterium]|nr:GGDEF domain-containing protein [Lachnospiraceae bacterium]
MGKYSLDTFRVEDASVYLRDHVDAIVAVDGKANAIKPLSKEGIFRDFIRDNWSYTDMIEKLWYHFQNSAEAIVDDYRVFLATSGKFQGKYSRRVNIMIDGNLHVIQILVYPVEEDFYLYLMEELDKSAFREEDMTNKKVDTIQKIYLFSMYIDIVKDTTSSISVTELSGDVMNQQLKYSEWRMMIVNMIGKEYQAQFLEETDPETLKKKYAPGRTSSFDCMMMNLEGEYIWVKLILSRAETSNADDYRFVFMVQNIHEEFAELRRTLKEYEQRASMDSLTSIFNHGRIETEMCNAIVERGKNGRPLSIMMLDIDFFKQINDVFGHAVGDSTLVQFTRKLSDCISDRNAVLGRWGGEEFAVVCYDTDGKAAEELAETIRKAIEENEFERIGNITCSIGVTEVKEDDSFNKAFERSDSALYQAKTDGRNRVVVF